MAETKQRKWSPPKGWESSHSSQTISDGEAEDTIFTGTRTYPDGTKREIVAHSPDEFDTLAARTDESMRQQHGERRQALLGEVRELRARARDLEQQAKQYDW